MLFDSALLKVEAIGCPETSVINYHYTLRNSPEERSSYLLHGKSLKSFFEAHSAMSIRDVKIL